MGMFSFKPLQGHIPAPYRSLCFWRPGHSLVQLKKKTSFTFHLTPPTLAPYLISFPSSPRTRPTKSHCSRIDGDNACNRSRTWIINQTGNLISTNENAFPIFSNTPYGEALTFGLCPCSENTCSFQTLQRYSLPKNAVSATEDGSLHSCVGLWTPSFLQEQGWEPFYH